MVLQWYGAAGLWCCSAVAVLLSFLCLDKQCIWAMSITDLQTDRATARGPSGPKKKGHLEKDTWRETFWLIQVLKLKIMTYPKPRLWESFWVYLNLYILKENRQTVKSIQTRNFKPFKIVMKPLSVIKWNLSGLCLSGQLIIWKRLLNEGIN